MRGSSAHPTQDAWKSTAAQGILCFIAIFFGMETYFGNRLINERAAIQLICFPLALLVLWHGYRVVKLESGPAGRRIWLYWLAIAMTAWQAVSIIVNNGGYFLEYAPSIYLCVLPPALCLMPRPDGRSAVRRLTMTAIMLALPFILFGWLGVYMWRVGATNASLAFLHLPSGYAIMEPTLFLDNELQLFQINANLVSPIAFGGALLSLGLLLPSRSKRITFGGALIKILLSLASVMSYLVLILTQGTSANIAFCLAASFITFCLTYRAFERPGAKSAARAALRICAAVAGGLAMLAVSYFAADIVREAIRWHPQSSLAESAEAQVPATESAADCSPAPEDAATPAPLVTNAPIIRNSGDVFFSKNILNRIGVMLDGDNRVRLWRIIADMLREEPSKILFGIMPVSLNQALSPYYDASEFEEYGEFEAIDMMEIINNNNAHNSYLQALLASGLPGLIMWLVFVIAHLLPAIRALMTKRADMRIAAPIALSIAALAMAFTESHYFSQLFVVNLALFISLGCSDALARDYEASV